MYYEENILFDGDSKTSTPNDSEPTSTPDKVDIDYNEIEKAMYNALKRLDTENKVQEMAKSEPESDVVVFSSSTDAQMLTGQTAVVPTSSAQQTTAYLLDIRNILLIFLFAYFVITVYSKIKNSLINYLGD